jgi:hypothetical protein
VRAILDAAPGALPILCHGFADAIDWPQLVDAGVFHSLSFPFDLQEVRRSLGFVWSAKHVRQPAQRAIGRQEQSSLTRPQGVASGQPVLWRR